MVEGETAAASRSHRVLWFLLPALAIALGSAAYYFMVQSNPRVHNERSRVLAARGDTAGAIAELRQSIRLDPGSAEVHENLGLLLVTAGDVDGGIAEYREAIRLLPDYGEAHYNLGRAFISRGDAEAAKAEYQMVVTPSTPHGLAGC